MENQKIKHSFWKRFFIVLGIIFAALLVLIAIVFAYVAIKKPLGIDVTQLPKAIIGGGATKSTYDHPLLNTQQEIFLQNLGVNTKTLPTQISPAQEACSVSALGQVRVDAIKAGSALTANDYIKAGNCFK